MFVILEERLRTGRKSQREEVRPGELCLLSPLLPLGVETPSSGGASASLERVGCKGAFLIRSKSGQDFVILVVGI